MTSVSVAGRRLQAWIALRLPQGAIGRIGSLAIASAVGAGVALSGFNPLNNAVDVMGVPQAPALVVFTPAVLLALLALVGARAAPARWSWQSDVRLVIAGAVMLAVAAGLSLAASDDLWYSIIIATIAILAPLALAVGVARSRLPPGLIAGAFLLACCLMLLRADLVFVQLHGLPTPATLYEVKYSNRAYDFHYYTLANPTGTAAWLLMPLALALFWATGRASPSRRVALSLAALLIGISLVLVYSRSALALGALLTIAALLSLPWKPALRHSLVGFSIAAAIAFALTGSNRAYFAAVLSTDPVSSGGERIATIIDGAGVALDHPLTGVGLGRYNVETGYIPAHSSVVQAGAETGLLGAAGLLLLTIAAVLLALRRVRTHGIHDVRTAAAIAVSAYLIYTAFTAGASEGLYSGYVSVWGLTLGLLFGLAAGGDAPTGDDRAA
ncbi:MAG: O-antigen ligase family protein [Chloroflexota bacterium]|nr:O-antigen ligase family protein [Chloroflexota bacterium]